MGLALASLGLWAGLAGAQQPTQAPVTVPVVEAGSAVAATTAPGGPVGCTQGQQSGPGAAGGNGAAGGPGHWAGLPRLQSGYGAPGQIFYPYTQIAPPTVTPPTQVGPARYVPPNYPPLQPDPANPRPFRNTLQWFGVGCWSHHNQVGCSSLRSELTFIFGSCRAFFGLPCQHGPPSVPVGGPMPIPNFGPKSPPPDFAVLPPASFYFAEPHLFGPVAVTPSPMPAPPPGNPLLTPRP